MLYFSSPDFEEISISRDSPNLEKYWWVFFPYLPIQVLRECRCELQITVEDYNYLVDSLEGLSNLWICLKVFTHTSRGNSWIEFQQVYVF